MKTFGLYILIIVISTLVCEWAMPKPWSEEGKFIIGLIIGWSSYRLIKEDFK